MIPGVVKIPTPITFDTTSAAASATPSRRSSFEGRSSSPGRNRIRAVPYMPLAAGTRLGPYEIISPLGAGGMGEVYRACDTKLGRGAAIKLLLAETAEDYLFFRCGLRGFLRAPEGTRPSRTSFCARA